MPKRLGRGIHLDGSGSPTRTGPPLHRCAVGPAKYLYEHPAVAKATETSDCAIPCEIVDRPGDSCPVPSEIGRGGALVQLHQVPPLPRAAPEVGEQRFAVV